MLSGAGACFGIPSVYSSRSDRCSECPMAGQCVETIKLVVAKLGDSELQMTVIALLALNEGIDAAPRVVVEQKPRKTRAKWIPSPQHAALLMNVPANVAKIMRGILKHEQDVIQALIQGCNPFSESRLRSAHKAFERIMDGGATQHELSLAFCESLGWSKPAAVVQASVLTRAFRELGIVVMDDDGVLRVNPTINSNTTSL